MKSFTEFFNEGHIDNLRTELEDKIAHCNNAEQLAKYQEELKKLLDSENKQYK